MSGACLAYSEAIGFGVKQLGLSSLYTDEELEVMLKVIDYASQRYGTVYLPETDLIQTKLFQRDIAKGKTVVLIAHDQSVLDKYSELKGLKEKSNKMGNPEELELDIARRFGKLLSYDDATINRLTKKNG